MSDGVRRGVTRGYVGGLIAATLITAVALLVAGWGGIALAADREPVTRSEIPMPMAPSLIVAALAVLGWLLWRAAIVLLRGRRAPSWDLILIAAGVAYLVWCLGGLLAGMPIGDTWTSPFAGVLALVWALSSLLFWAVLARRVYTDRATPKWPWERHDENGAE